MRQRALGLMVDARELQRARHRHHRPDGERAGQRDPEPEGAHRRRECIPRGLEGVVHAAAKRRERFASPRVAQRAFEPFPGRAHPPASINVGVRSAAR
jgi:hypothetical protein